MSLRKSGAWNTPVVQGGDDGDHAGRIAAYDEALLRLGDASDPGDQLEVAILLGNKAYALDALGRFEESVAAYTELAARFEDADDPALRSEASRGLFGLAYELGRLGRADEAIDAYDRLVARFGDDSEPKVRERVLRALENKRIDLVRLGRGAEALETHDEILARLDAAGERGSGERVVESLRRKALLLDGLDRPEEALVVLGGAAAVLDEQDEPTPELEAATADALVARASVLHRLGRDGEAIGAYDEVVERFGDSADDALAERVAGAMLDRAAMLREAGGAPDLEGLRDELLSRFGSPGADDDEARPLARRPRAPRTEASAAALLARTLASDCWTVFAGRAAGASEEERAALAGRALDLYRRTKPLVETSLEEPLGQAGLVLRFVADGFAALSRRWSPVERWEFVLPDRASFESVIRLFHLDEWAENLGHPLDLQTTDEQQEAAIERLGSGSGLDSEGLGALMADCARELWQYDLLLGLRETKCGRGAVRSAALRNLACRRIAASRRWTARGLPQTSEAQAAVVAIVLVAQAHFVESWTETSSGRVFPGTAFLGEMLRDTGALDRLRESGAELPDWTAED
jgi:tetratricopeptide (TPR) repeat protein